VGTLRRKRVLLESTGNTQPGHAIQHGGGEVGERIENSMLTHWA
jgi:hypothetical protein